MTVVAANEGVAMLATSISLYNELLGEYGPVGMVVIGMISIAALVIVVGLLGKLRGRKIKRSASARRERFTSKDLRKMRIQRLSDAQK